MCTCIKNIIKKYKRHKLYMYHTLFMLFFFLKKTKTKKIKGKKGILFMVELDPWLKVVIIYHSNIFFVIMKE